MKIALGTQSENKIKYLKNILKHFDVKDYNLTTHSVPSGVSEQPITRHEIIKGAVTRSRNAFVKDKSVNLSVGMEGGLIFMNKEDVYYECVVVVYNGSKFFTGISSSMKVPKEVALKVREHNADLSDELNAYKAKSNKQQILKDMILSREEMFFEALRNVFLEILED
tara:strand:- start:2681 stop:3181 length:501 start_codon:yes stop_codon:yes gene_type:complete